ncbi:MAG: tRNA 2-thiouridine(34) synthase MnmA [Spirochaetia bacterium]
MHSEQPVVIGLSGGVDSSVAAHLLLQQGYTVIGASHYIREEKDYHKSNSIQGARVLAKDLGIPYFEIDMRDDFYRCVMQDFTNTYLRGMTPNPCVRCNERIRFSQFLERVGSILVAEGFAATATDFFFSTGHYVRTREKDGTTFLQKGTDRRKDQSYMLYRIPPAVLPQLIFPLGDLTKIEVKQIAKTQGFASADSGESQDICFIQGDYPSFIRDFASTEKGNKPGRIYSSSGEYLGDHRGYLHYTIGQRKGLGLANGPWYVSAIDAHSNIVTVADSDQFGTNEFQVCELTWTHPAPWNIRKCDVKVRYNSRQVPCSLFFDDNSVIVKLQEKQGITPGQSAVFYEDDTVLGGGIIGRSI